MMKVELYRMKGVTDADRITEHFVTEAIERWPFVHAEIRRLNTITPHWRAVLDRARWADDLLELTGRPGRFRVLLRDDVAIEYKNELAFEMVLSEDPPDVLQRGDEIVERLVRLEQALLARPQHYRLVNPRPAAHFYWPIAEHPYGKLHTRVEFDPQLINRLVSGVVAPETIRIEIIRCGTDLSEVGRWELPSLNFVAELREALEVHAGGGIYRIRILATNDGQMFLQFNVELEGPMKRFGFGRRS